VVDNGVLDKYLPIKLKRNRTKKKMKIKKEHFILDFLKQKNLSFSFFVFYSLFSKADSFFLI
jgi:hypothetical protein